MELDDLEENIENQVKIEAKAEKSKKDDWKQNFFDINTMSDYIKANGHKDLQRFTIIEKIGKGSESLVYKVRVNNTNNAPTIRKPSTPRFGNIRIRIPPIILVK